MMTLFIIRWAFVSRESEGRKDEEKLAKYSERERVCVCVFKIDLFFLLILSFRSLLVE